MRLRRLFVLIAAVLALAACTRTASRHDGASAPMAYSELDARMYGAPQPPPRVTRVARQPMPTPVAVMFEEGPYTLDSGDKLRIVVFGQDALSNNYTVDAAGQITMPLIGSVYAQGQTTSQLLGAIASRLRQSFIRDPSVAVEIEVYRPFFMLGEVTYPGQYPYVPNMTLENAIAIAGGFTPRASKDRVTVTRKTQAGPVRQAMPLRYPVRPGDIVTVAERWF